MPRKAPKTINFAEWASRPGLLVNRGELLSLLSQHEKSIVARCEARFAPLSPSDDAPCAPQIPPP